MSRDHKIEREMYGDFGGSSAIIHVDREVQSIIRIAVIWQVPEAIKVSATTTAGGITAIDLEGQRDVTQTGEVYCDFFTLHDICNLMDWEDMLGRDSGTISFSTCPWQHFGVCAEYLDWFC